MTMTKYKCVTRHCDRGMYKHKKDAEWMGILKANIDGEVLSGHPIVTSTGNTLRVIAYVKYLEYKMRDRYRSLKIFPG